MSKQMPLLAELSNCLSAYTESLERILKCIEHACDVNHKKHDSPVILQVQDLLSIDAELKRHLLRMDEWSERRQKIEELEKTLSTLSMRVNDFAKNLSAAQTSLQGCLATAQKIQRSVQHQELPTVSDILMSAKNISKAASGAPAHRGEFPWMPQYNVMNQATIFKDSLQLEAPTITTESTNVEKLKLNRSLGEDESD
ncbi:hypothetical protein TVAG_282530 [Trichomonas vaginalis G3]|uniref:Mediator of RNA polymerase II transcription subunit 4 n=1 Tax=Trichomonas vaginalis (strain ATCC PRA-98 / G3) TaxID=412133 RepID=A2DEF6_TRIV3|nr:vitamin-D-receptor interacting Mediator subunit 4 family [Trichomonas vaginalis G3]EAY21083.1 hypothetical protein TVAG_282530 [Trichomonas vaginalis G3]KAI5539989.1 vitamin-D-receptor interacting Mediator subunit 4 family [Trichomonas vaginalis G3]|eukprot:XP_001582069.1 hypothetical protein [Trichomonas vaginalis G3]